MQRWIRAILAAGAIVSMSIAAGADEPFAPNYDGRLLRRHQEQLRKARADELCHERARMRARERYSGNKPSAALDYRPGLRRDDIRR